MKTKLTLLLSVITIIGSAAASAQLPPPPSGFHWELQSTKIYTDKGNFSQSLNGTQSLAPAAPPVVSSLAETLSLTSFDAEDAESTLESANPGMDYAIVVLSSDYTASLNAAGSTEVFNFDNAFAPHDYSGTTSASNFQIDGAGSAGPTTDSLVNSAFTVTPFETGDYADETSGLTAATVSLIDSGTAPTDGSTLNFNYKGSFILALFSDDPSALNQLGIMTSTAFGAAEVNTNYEIHKLVADIPEPSSTAFAMLAGLFILRRRR